MIFLLKLFSTNESTLVCKVKKLRAKAQCSYEIGLIHFPMTLVVMKVKASGHIPNAISIVQKWGI